MKASKIFLLLILLIAVTSLFSCKKEESQSEKEVKTKQLIGQGTPWALENLKIDGVDATDLHTGMTLTFADKTYNATNGEPVWPAEGTWEFSDEHATIIMRDGTMDLVVSELSGDKLVLELMWDKDTFTTGRIRSISGKYLFTFVR